jgi:hypothetical protein
MAGLLLVSVLVSSCGAGGSDPAGSTGAPEDGSWAKFADSPLSARYAAHAVSIDDRLFVVGGTAAEPCPPNASCIEPTEAPFVDGAVYDPREETWTKIADAPVSIGYGSSAVVGDKVYLLLNGYGSSNKSVRAAFVSYDTTEDRWEEHPLPPNQRERILASAGPNVVAFQSTQENGVKGDFVYDPNNDAWSELAADPLLKSFDRWMVWTPEGLALLGIEVVPQPGSTEPAVYRAALLKADGTWKRFPDSEIIGYNPMWSWTGGEVLNASSERADGGETNNWGRTYFAGGTLNPSTGEWGSLPDVPKERGEFEDIYAAGDRYAVAYSGWVFDAQEQRWFHLTRPEGGPDVDTAAALVDDQLFIWGGVRWDGSEAVVLDDGWAWHPDA